MNIFIYLFGTKRERGREGESKQKQGQQQGWGRLTTKQGGPQMWGSVSGPWDHDPNQNSPLNQLSHPSAPTK